MTTNFDHNEFNITATHLWRDYSGYDDDCPDEAAAVRRLRDHLNTYPGIDDNQPAWAVLDSPERDAAEQNIDLWQLRAAWIDACARHNGSITTAAHVEIHRRDLADALDKDTP